MKDQETQDLTKLLQALVRDSLDGGSAERLVGYAVERTHSVLLWLSQKKKYRFVDLGLDIRDVAYDVVGELLAGESTHCCRQLRFALQENENDTPDDLLSAFEAVLFKNVQQHLVRIFGEIDPLSQHLLRSLRGHIYRSTDILTIDRFDGRWYALDGTAKADLAKPAMPTELLQRSLRLRPMQPVAPAVRYFRSLLLMLEEQDEYRRALNEGDILSLVRDALRLQYLTGYDTQPQPGYDYDIAVLGNVLHDALDLTLPWAEEMYVKKRRLTQKELKCFVSAIQMYFKDLMGETETLGPYIYLRKSMPGLTHERFRESYRRKFEYILQRVLDEASRRLEKEKIHLK